MKPRNIFLYIAIVCFTGIVAIFIFAGYLGTYDTVYISTGEYEQRVGPEFWIGQQGPTRYPYSVGAVWGEPVLFRYEIDNRRFSGYVATVDATLWKGNQKVLDLLHEDISIANFGRATLSWTLAPDALEQAGLAAGQYTVKIRRGDFELGQGIIIGFYQGQPGIPIKPVPAL